MQLIKQKVSKASNSSPQVNKKISKTTIKTKQNQTKKKNLSELKTTKTKTQAIKVPDHLAIYTVPQYEKYLNLFQAWQKKTNEELKYILHLNQQTMTGNKQQLVNKVCDGIILGAIPRCPTCYKSRLRFDQSNGIYQCPGDSRDFEWCQEVLGFNDVKRNPWIR